MSLINPPKQSKSTLTKRNRAQRRQSSQRRWKERNRVLRIMRLEDRLVMAAIIHLDASRPATIQTNSSDDVSVWSDRTVNGNDASSDIGSVVYTGNETMDSGIAALDFGSARNTLQLASSSESDAWLDQSDGTGGFTVAAVVERKDSIGNWNDLLGNTSSVNSDGFFIRLNDSGVLYAKLGDVAVQKSGAVAGIGETIAVTFRYNAADESYALWDSVTNTTQTGTIAHADFSLSSPVRLGGTTSNNRHFDGLVGEVQIHDQPIDDAELSILQNHLVNKWSVPSEPNLAIHLDASIPITVQTDALGAVSEWDNLSDAGAYATSAVGDVFYGNGAVLDSGIEGLDFGSSRSSLELASAAQSDAWLDQSGNADGFTVLLAVEPNSLVSNWNDLIGNTSGVNSNGFGIRYSSGGNLVSYLGGQNFNKGTQVQPGETILLSYRYDPSSGIVSFWDSDSDQTQTQNVTPDDFSLNNAVTLGSTSNGNRFVDSLVGEVKIYDAALTNTQLATQQSQLADKWLGDDSSIVRWTDFLMPDGSVPTTEDVVVVPPETTLLVDATMEVEGVIVVGDLVVEDHSTPIEMTSDWVLVVGGGRFLVGSPQNPYENEFTLNLVGDDPNFDLNVGDYLPGNTMAINNNTAFLMAMGADSEISIHAADASKSTWTQLDETADANTRTIVVADTTGWEVGDEIAIASTDFDLNQAEQFRIDAINGNTITLDQDLQYMHYGEIDQYSNSTNSWDLDMRAEVGLLNRNVTIQGREDAGDQRINYDGQNRRIGGHTMVMNGAEMYISGVAFARMGQEGIIGRYPTHWHLSGDVSDDFNSQDPTIQGQYIENSSFVETYNKGITIHGAQYASVQNNLLYEHIGHGVYAEDGAEWGNQVINNLSINARKSDTQAIAAVRHDFTDVSSFWFKHYDNVIQGNHSAGSEAHGIYFQLIDVKQPSLGTGLYDDVDPSLSGPTQMSDNTFHSFADIGIYVDQVLTNQIGDVDFDAQNPQLGDKDWSVRNETVYKGGTGLYARGIGGEFRDSIVAEMGAGTTRLRLNQTVYDSAFIGRSLNVGNPDTPGEILEGRSMFRDANRFAGHQFYDGPGGLVNVHFDGFDTGEDAAIVQSNAVHKSTSWFVTGLTWGQDTAYDHRVSFNPQNREWNERWVHALIDLDGSLTGVPGATIVPQISGGSQFNVSRDSQAGPSLGAGSQINDPSTYNGTLSFNGPVTGPERPVGDRLLTVDLTRVDVSGVEAPEVIEGFDGNSAYTQFGFVINDGFEYTVDFDTSDPHFTNSLDLYLRDVLEGDSQVFRLESINAGASVSIYNPYLETSQTAPEVSSLAALRNTTTTSVYRAADAIYVNLVSEDAYGWLWPQPSMTIDSRVIGGVYVRITGALPSAASLFQAPGQIQNAASPLVVAWDPSQVDLGFESLELEATLMLSSPAPTTSQNTLLTLNAELGDENVAQDSDSESLLSALSVDVALLEIDSPLLGE